MNGTGHYEKTSCRGGGGGSSESDCEVMSPARIKDPHFHESLSVIDISTAAPTARHSARALTRRLIDVLFLEGQGQK